MPGTKCIIPWCNKVCTTVVCALCRGKITRIKSELGGVRFKERPEAFKLFWEKRNSFKTWEACVISHIAYQTVLTHFPVARERGFFRRREVISLAEMRAELDRLRKTHLPLQRAAQFIGGVTADVLSKGVSAGLIPAVRPKLDPRVAFIDETTLLSLIEERQEVLSLSEGARELGVKKSVVLDAVAANRIQVVKTRIYRFPKGIERSELKRLKATYVTKLRGYRTIPKVAVFLKRDKDTIRRWLEESKYPTYQSLGGWTLVDKATFTALKERNTRERSLIGWREGSGLLGVHEKILAETAAKYNLRTLRPSGRWALDPEDLEKIAGVLGVESPNPQVLKKRR